MIHYPFHLLNSPGPSQYSSRSSSTNDTLVNDLYCVQSSGNEPQSGGGSQGTIEQVFPSAESHSRSDAALGVPENAPTK